MTKLTREEAERIYASQVMEFGNPEYFIYRAVRNWKNDVLLYELEQFIGTTDYEIEDEE